MRFLRDRQSLSRFGEAAFGLAAREPLVLQRHGQPGPAAELFGKGLHVRGHVVWAAVEPARQADDDGRHAVVLGGEPSDLVGDARHGGRVEPRDRQHGHRTRQRAGRVADGEADAALAHVESHHAHSLY